MLRIASSYLVKQSRISLLYAEQRATYIRGYWPEPITQQTLAEFLKDINYFEEPTKFINIGLEHSVQKNVVKTPDRSIEANTASQANTSSSNNVDDVMALLALEAEVPPLNYDDIRPSIRQLKNLAINSGIFRDLFNEGKYSPDRKSIRFTQKQAENLNRLVPFYWITDQPFARVERHPKEIEPLHYFDPIIGISARFINDASSQQKIDGPSDDLCAHISYYGNIIPASEALTKPSISLDGSLLLQSPSSESIIGESQIDNWEPGNVKLVNFSQDINKYYTVALINLDHLHEDNSNLHWMISNIKPSMKGTSSYDEICDYLPVHGIQGFGYSRYVFLVFQHDSKLNSDSSRVEGFSLESRKFNAASFMRKHRESNLVPVGLSWFQTSWDITSNGIFHNYLNLKAPVYEHVQTKLEAPPEKGYPGKIPFNIYLDHVTSKKTLNERALLERLKTVDPFDYKDQYVPPKVPPTVFEYDGPSWMKNVMFKKRNKVGYWRGLRPASALLPLDNNADLDYPLRPVSSSKKTPPDFPNLYQGKIKYKAHKDMPTSKPASEHQAVFVQDDHEVHVSKVMKILEDFNSKRNTKSKGT